MAELKKIEERTLQFIEAHARLKGANKMVTHEDLAKIIGAESKSTISEILSKRQNIQPEQWSLFKAHFKISTEYSVQSGLKTGIVNEDPAVYNKELPLGDLKITLKDYLDLVKQMAEDAKKEKERLYNLLEKNLTELVLNSKTTLEGLARIQNITVADDGVNMAYLDRAQGLAPGTSAAIAGSAERELNNLAEDDDTRVEDGKLGTSDKQ